MSGNSIPLSYTVHTGPVIPLSQCGNEREVFVFQFQSGITSNKQTNKKKKHTHTTHEGSQMEVECYKTWASSSPESCNSQMFCPFFLFSSSFLSILYTGIWYYGSTEGIIAFSQCHGGGL